MSEINLQKNTHLQKNQILLNRFCEIRERTETICKPLAIEDYVVQPIIDVSPPKWHLGHTTWFFETMLLIPFDKDYKPFDEKYNFIFNSFFFKWVFNY